MAVRTGLVYDERYLTHDPGEWHPERPDRLKAIVRRLYHMNLMEEVEKIPPYEAPLPWIEKLHDAAYVKRFREAFAKGQRIFMVPDCGICRESYDIARLATGGVMAAVDAVVFSLFAITPLFFPRLGLTREQMKQVFMNLILNAIQSMTGEGSITISSREITRRGTSVGQFVQVEVRDTGVGISEENLDHIFDPFFTSGKEEGSGLGLAVSHQIIQEHGGFVTVESKLGQGTTFFVHVPVGAPVRAIVNCMAHANEANLSH